MCNLAGAHKCRAVLSAGGYSTLVLAAWLKACLSSCHAGAEGLLCCFIETSACKGEWERAGVWARVLEENKKLV